MERDDDMFGLDQLARAQARSVGRVELRAATPDQVDIVVSLKEVAQIIVDHCTQVMMGEPGRWAELADVLQVAARTCRNQVIVDPDDTSSGNRPRT